MQGHRCWSGTFSLDHRQKRIAWPIRRIQKQHDKQFKNHHRWINFYIKSSRDGFSAYVTNWNSAPLEGANINRIKREVWHRLEALGDRVKRFAPLWNDAAWSVLTPKTGDVNSAIISEVSPLLFFCSNPKCRRVAEYRYSDQFLRNHTNNMHCKFCNPSLPAVQRPAMTQVQMVYYCECGWAGPVKKPYAP